MKGWENLDLKKKTSKHDYREALSEWSVNALCSYIIKQGDDNI